MPKHNTKNTDESPTHPQGISNPRFVRVDELDRLLDAIVVVTTHLELEEEDAS